MAFEYEPYGIVIDGSGACGEDYAEQYEAHVKQVITLMLRSDTAKALLTCLGSMCAEHEPTSFSDAIGKNVLDFLGGGTTMKVRILPIRLTNGVEATAYSTETFRGTGERFSSFAKDHKRPKYQRADGVCISFDPTELSGSPSPFAIEPRAWGWPLGPNSATRTPPISLLHELCHAYRRVRGTYNAAPLAGTLSSYEDEEEFFAILVQNIYVSDPTSQVQGRFLKPDAHLRAGHGGYDALPPSLSTSAAFIDRQTQIERRRLVGKLYTQETKLVGLLSLVQASFNPFKEYIDFLRAPLRQLAPGPSGLEPELGASSPLRGEKSCQQTSESFALRS